MVWPPFFACNEVLSGIPQGSVIGPILFVIFISDMSDSLKYNLCKLFADDCKLYGKVASMGENLVQADLTHLEEWSRIWQLPFNAEKCKSTGCFKKNDKILKFIFFHFKSTNEISNWVFREVHLMRVWAIGNKFSPDICMVYSSRFCKTCVF